MFISIFISIFVTLNKNNDKNFNNMVLSLDMLIRGWKFEDDLEETLDEDKKDLNKEKKMKKHENNLFLDARDLLIKNK